MPAVPVRLYYGERDLDVGAEQSIVTADWMTGLGADVEAISAGETNHTETVYAALPDVLAWFDTFAPMTR